MLFLSSASLINLYYKLTLLLPVPSTASFLLTFLLNTKLNSGPLKGPGNWGRV